MKRTLAAILATFGLLTSTASPVFANASTGIHAKANLATTVHQNTTPTVIKGNALLQKHKGLYYNPKAPKTIDIKNLSNNAYMWRANAPTNSSGGIVPQTTYTGNWGTSTLYAQDGLQEFYWKVSPYDLESYVYTMDIDLYTSQKNPTYLGSIQIGAGGIGAQSGYIGYDMTDLSPGQYYAKLTGTWTGSEGTRGSVGGSSGAAGTVFNIAI